MSERQWAKADCSWREMAGCSLAMDRMVSAVSVRYIVSATATSEYAYWVL